jgi:hypothetical protein
VDARDKRGHDDVPRICLLAAKSLPSLGHKPLDDITD